MSFEDFIQQVAEWRRWADAIAMALAPGVILAAAAVVFYLRRKGQR